MNLVAQEWYQALIEECKSIITEAVFTSRWALVQGYWELGQRITDDGEYKKWGQNSAGVVLQDLAKLHPPNFVPISYSYYPPLSFVPTANSPRPKPNDL